MGRQRGGGGWGVEKIKLDTMIADYDQGGLKMVDVPLFAKSLKSAWIKKYLDQSNREKWKLVFAANLRELDDQKDGCFSARVIANLVRNYLLGYDGFHRPAPVTTHLVNFLTRIENEPVYFKLWDTNGVLTISNLMTNDGTFLSFSDL